MIACPALTYVLDSGYAVESRSYMNLYQNLTLHLAGHDIFQQLE